MVSKKEILKKILIPYSHFVQPNMAGNYHSGQIETLLFLDYSKNLLKSI